MNDELQDLRNAGYKPVLVGPQPFSFEEILRNVDPAPDISNEATKGHHHGGTTLSNCPNLAGIG